MSAATRSCCDAPVKTFFCEGLARGGTPRGPPSPPWAGATWGIGPGSAVRRGAPRALLPALCCALSLRGLTSLVSTVTAVSPRVHPAPLRRPRLAPARAQARAAPQRGSVSLCRRRAAGSHACPALSCPATDQRRATTDYTESSPVKRRRGGARTRCATAHPTKMSSFFREKEPTLMPKETHYALSKMAWPLCFSDMRHRRAWTPPGGGMHPWGQDARTCSAHGHMVQGQGVSPWRAAAASHRGHHTLALSTMQAFFRSSADSTRNAVCRGRRACRRKKRNHTKLFRSPETRALGGMSAAGWRRPVLADTLQLQSLRGGADVAVTEYSARGTGPRPHKGIQHEMQQTSAGDRRSRRRPCAAAKKGGGVITQPCRRARRRRGARR
jgi:hypothetical protein